jgi:AI-2 transport protein TqsA
VYADIDRQIRQYVTTKVVLSVATGGLVWLSLHLIGMPLAGVFGLLAFLLNFIPSIGSIISTLLPIPVAVASFETVGPVVLVILIPGAIQMIIGNGIEPKLMGEGLNLHPVTVLLTLSFWGMLWGVMGMLLAVPMTAVIRIVLIQFETLRPVGDLLAGKLPGDDEDSD